MDMTRLPAPPTLSIHLPISNADPATVRRLLDRLAALDDADFDVLVVDHDTTDPACWESVARHCARLGPRFRFVTLGRCDRSIGGALNFARLQTRADVVMALDPDAAAPRSLARLLRPFARDRVGLVRGDGVVLVRADALAAIGGWSERCAWPEAEAELRLAQVGWQSAGLRAAERGASHERRLRLAYGGAQALRRHAGGLLFARQPGLRRRIDLVAGLLPGLADAAELALLMATLVGSAALTLAPAHMTVSLPLLVAALAFALVHLAEAGAERMAEAHDIGLATWMGLVGRRGGVPVALRHTGATQRRARGLLALTAAAALGVAATHALFADGVPTTAALWCAMLAVQALPSVRALRRTPATAAVQMHARPATWHIAGGD